MRAFRDAKAMARALRDALKSKAIETTHAETLELIAKAFGYENWNILSAKIDAAEPAASHEDSPSTGAQDDPASLRRPSTARSAARASTRCASSLRGRRC